MSPKKPLPPIEVLEPSPGALGRIIEMHGRYYAQHWGLGPAFEAEVAQELGTFYARLDPARDGLWVAQRGEAVLGSVAIDGSGHFGSDVRLRWLILDEAAQGGGVGRQLLAKALDFSRECGARAVFLWTFDGLRAARRLYDAAGFVLTDRFVDTAWGTPVEHQRFDLTLRQP